MYYLYVHSQLCSHNIQNMVGYIIIILSYFLLCAVHLMQCFIYEKMLQGNQKYSQDRSFLTGNEENPALCFQTYTTEHQPQMVPCSVIRASPCIPLPWCRTPCQGDSLRPLVSVIVHQRQMPLNILARWLFRCIAFKIVFYNLHILDLKYSAFNQVS